MLLYAFGQRRVLGEGFGFNHFLIFWGFLALLPVNAEFLVAGVFPQFSLAFLGPVLYAALLLAADLMSLVVLAAVVVAAVRRLFFRPAYIEPTLDAFIILTLIGLADDRLLRHERLRASELGRPEMAAWMPISRLLSGLAAGRSARSACTLRRASSGGFTPWCCCSS